jgi:ribosomal protein L11 methylase PrmA
LFKHQGEVYRQVNIAYRADYELLTSSGLYEFLVGKGWLIPHTESQVAAPDPRLAHKVILPEQLSFIAYPYEWCFSQLKDAALLTLKLQKRALKHGMSLKDAAGTNIQFLHGRPVLIDSLSFEAYAEGQPWVAYRQFCQHFLAPLALMSRVNIQLVQLLRTNIDGIPLDLASRLLPASTRVNTGLLSHIHLHAAAQRRYAGHKVKGGAGPKVSKTNLLGLIDSLERTVKGLSWTPSDTAWGAYYEDTNYSDAAMLHKEALVGKYLEAAKPKTVWDMGANTGRFSRLASQRGIETVAFDIDPAAVEINYREVKNQKEQNLLPLLLDLTNPSPDLGWAHRERQSLLARGPADMLLALALVHHLAITNNVPLPQIAEFFSQLAGRLVVEFVPKEDSQVQRLLAARKDIFDDYTLEGFKKAFSQYYKIETEQAVNETARTMFLMKRRD